MSISENGKCDQQKPETAIYFLPTHVRMMKNNCKVQQNLAKVVFFKT